MECIFYRRIAHGWMPVFSRAAMHAFLTNSVLMLSLCGHTAGSLGADKAQPKTPAIALSEMQSIADAIQVCELDTIFYVAPEALNDISNPSSNPIYNYINDQGGTYVISPPEGTFRPARRNLLTGINQWAGPYLNYQPARTQLGLTPYDQGSPLDPWGTPYLFFSPLGLLRGDSGTATLEFYADAFDRYTLISLGPDTVKSGDDIIYQFGGGIDAFAVSSVRSAAAGLNQGAARSTEFSLANGQDAIVRGINLGAVQNGAEVRWGTEIFPVVSWSNREVRFSIPTTATGTANLTIRRAAAETNPLPLTLSEPVTAVSPDWHLYP